MDKKIAIVMEGGGMACSYGAGVMDALIKEYNFINPDIIIASSGGSGTMSYYVSKQYGSIINIWSNLLSTKKFINCLRFWKIIDIDYLIDNVFNKQDKLDKEKVYSSNINYLISTTNFYNGNIKYFSNKDNINILEIMRATMAMPIAFNKVVNINNQKYCDSLINSQADLHILKAIELGATHIIVIRNNFKWWNRFWSNIWLLFRSKKFLVNYYSWENKIKTLNIPNGINIINISPTKILKISNLNNNGILLKEAINLGYNDCKNNELLKGLLYFNNIYPLF